MKFRLILSILFFIATTVATIHEIEHIAHDHDHASCEMCVVAQNFLSSDIDHRVDDIENLRFGAIGSSFVFSFKQTLHPTCQPRAPPLFS